MKEFIEKLIGRLEEEINWYETHGCDKDLKRGIIGANRHAIGIVNELAEEYKHCTLCYLQSPCEYQNENAILPNELLADNNGWIPCSERLPEEGVDVLVWFEYYRYGSYNRLYQTVGISYTYHGDWSGFVNGSSGWKQLRIIAWQPLPEPYKEGGE